MRSPQSVLGIILVAMVVLSAWPGAPADFARPARAAGSAGAPEPTPLLLESPSVTAQRTDLDVAIVIHDLEIWRNGTVFVDRNVIIQSGGKLLIENATVIVDASPTNHIVIEALPNATLEVRNATITTAWAPTASAAERAAGYYYLQSFGRLIIEDSDIGFAEGIALAGAGVAGSRIARNTIHDTWHSGVKVYRYATDVAIVGNTVLDLHNENSPRNPGAGRYDVESTAACIYVVDAARIDILDNTVMRCRGIGGIGVDSSVVGSYVIDTTARVIGNVVITSAAPFDGTRIGTYEAYHLGGGTEVDVADNTAITHEAGFLLVHGSGAHVTRNTIIGAPVEGGPGSSGTWALSHYGYLSVGTGASKKDVRDGTFTGNVVEGARVGFGQFYGGSPVVTGNDLARTTTAIEGYGAETTYAPDALFRFDGRGNWYGSPTGPRDAESDGTSTPDVNAGEGALVRGNVDYRDWLTEEPDPRVIPMEPVALVKAVPGETVTTAVRIGNVRAESAVVSLAWFNTPVDWTFDTPADITVPGGETVDILLSFTVPSTATPTGFTKMPVIVARTPGAASGTRVPVLVTPPVRVIIEEPSAGDVIDGIVTVKGVTALIGGTLPPDGAASTTGAPGGNDDGFLWDANADGVDDRIPRAGIADVIVRHRDRASIDSEALAGIPGAQVLHEFTLIPATWARIPADALATVAAAPGVLRVEWNEPVDAHLDVAARALRARDSSVPGVLGDGTAHPAAYTGVWSGTPVDGFLGFTGRGVLAAVLDAGIDETHASLDDMDDDAATTDPKVRVHLNAFTYLATGAVVNDPMPLGLDVDTGDSTHGTYAAGVLGGTGDSRTALEAGNANDRWAHAGVAPGATLADVVVFAPREQQQGLAQLAVAADMVAAYNERHRDMPIRVVSLSIGGTSPTDGFDATSAAYNALVDSGVVVVVSSGNNKGFVASPAGAAKVITVGATNTARTVDRTDDTVAGFSDSASPSQQAAAITKPELVAPGTAIRMPVADSLNGYAPESGTSFAAPAVAGIAALVLEANPGLLPAQVKSILARSAGARGGSSPWAYQDSNRDAAVDAPAGWVAGWGWGSADAASAVAHAQAVEPWTPAPIPAIPLFLHAESPDPAPPAWDTGAVTWTARGMGTTPPDRDTPAIFTVAPGEGVTFTGTVPELAVIGDHEPATPDVIRVGLHVVERTRSEQVSVWDLTLSDERGVIATSILDDHRINTGSTRLALLDVDLVIGHALMYADASSPTISLTPLADVPLDADGDYVVMGALTLAIRQLGQDSQGEDAFTLLYDSTAYPSSITVPRSPAIIPDSLPPAAVVGLVATAGDGAVDLAWSGGGDDVHRDHFEVQRDGATLATTEALSHRDAAAVNGARHTYRVRAIDLAGNTGEWSREIHSIPMPADASFVHLAIGGDTIAVTTPAADGSWSVDWNTRETAAGSGILQAEYRTSGLTDTTQVPIRVLPGLVGSPPDIAIHTPLPDAVVAGVLRMTGTAADTDPGDRVVGVEVAVDGGPWMPAWPLAEDWGMWAFDLDASVIPDGARTVTVRAVDTAGSSSQASLPVRVAHRALVWDPSPQDAVAGGSNVPFTFKLKDRSGGWVDDGAPVVRMTAPDGTSATVAAGVPIDNRYRAAWDTAGAAFGVYRIDVLVKDAVVATRALRLVDAPIPAFVHTPDRPTDLEDVVFVDATVGAIVSRTWDFGDGATSTLATPIHRFPDDGSYTVVLTVEDVTGFVSSTSRVVHVSNVAPLPVIAFEAGAGTTRESFAFTDKGGDPDGSIVSHAWAFGDGDTSTAAAPRHMYRRSGTYPVTLTTVDDDGASATTTLDVEVLNALPRAQFTSRGDVRPGFDIGLVDHTFEWDGIVVSREWDLGDGSTASCSTTGCTLVGADGTVTTDPGDRHPPHAFAAAGTYTVRLDVVDDEGAAASFTRTVRVDDGIPVAAILGPSEGSWVTGSVTAVAEAMDVGNPATGIARIEHTIDGVTGSYGSWRSTLPITGEGEHVLRVRPIDRAGNEGEWIERRFGIDNSPPTLAFEDAPRVAWEPAEYRVMAEDSLSGVAKVAFLVDGTVRHVDEDGTDGWTWQMDPGEYATGIHMVGAVATDHVGRTAAVEVRVFTVAG